MAAAQLPVLTLDIDESKIKALEDISEKFKAAFGAGPGGLPVPSSPTSPVPSVPGDDGKKSNKPPANAFDKFMKNLNKDAQRTVKTFTLINKTLGATTSTLKGLFTTTVSWGARIAAISGGGLFGYGYMSQRVAQQYQTSQGMNLTTGQMQAAHNVYGSRISGTENIMQSLAAAQNDPTNPQYAGLLSLGINPQDGAAANMPKLLQGVSTLLQQYKDTGVSQAVLRGHGLDGIIDVATANQVLANSDRIPQLNEQYAAQSRQLDQNMGDGTQRSFQDLSAKFDYNADRIGNTFLKTLSRLNGPIGEIADNLTASIEKFLNGRNGKALFDTLANGLERLGNWLGSDDFQSDLKTFADCVKNIISALGTAINWIAGNMSDVDINGTGTGPEGADPALVNFGNKYLGGMMPGANPMTNQYTGIFTEEKAHESYQMPDELKGNIQNFVSQANDAYKLPKGMMSAIAERESSWNPLAYNKASGAAGMWQFIPSTAKAYGLEGDDVYDPNKSTAAAGRYLNDLNRRYKGDVAKMLTSYNGGKIDKDGNLSLRMETVKYLMNVLPKIEGAYDQHPGLSRQLGDAYNDLKNAPADSRATINLQVDQKPGSDISAQVKGIYVTPR
ncbi:lytic transglycosylase domain-containing protein [Trabulsiella odontotermitis]|uniref:lytic transglycosylase domain-containing protein n=1 Tax=Trabulsiella odontotermitis TaxID=379893 RepID=UPI003AD25A7A